MKPLVYIAGRPGKPKGKRPTPFVERFWAKVRKADGDACWEWTAALDKKGYGQFMVTPSECRRAHRVAWLITNGDPGTLFVCHRCDNRICVNPAHLFLGTNLDNVRDMDGKGRRRTVAPRGSDHGNAVWGEADVREARRLKALGSTYDQLAERFGVSRATVAFAVTGRNWGWL